MGFMVWAWALVSVFLEHERNYGLGMDALSPYSLRNTESEKEKRKLNLRKLKG